MFLLFLSVCDMYKEKKSLLFTSVTKCKLLDDNSSEIQRTLGFRTTSLVWYAAYASCLIPGGCLLTLKWTPSPSSSLIRPLLSLDYALPFFLFLWLEFFLLPAEFFGVSNSTGSPPGTTSRDFLTSPFQVFILCAWLVIYSAWTSVVSFFFSFHVSLGGECQRYWFWNYRSSFLECRVTRTLPL